MSPPSPVVSGRQHSVGKCTHMLYTSHICFKHTYFHKKYRSSCNFIGWIRGGGWEIPSSLLPRGHTVWNCVNWSLGEDLRAHCVMNHGWKGGGTAMAVCYCCMQRNGDDEVTSWYKPCVEGVASRLFRPLHHWLGNIYEWCLATILSGGVILICRHRDSPT